MRWLCGVVLATTVAAAASAQSDGLTAPLERGRLVLWVVRPAPRGWSPENAARAAATLGPAGIPKTVQEQTAGSFGTPSSNVGTAASDYGQTASTLGQNAGDYGHAASTHGQTAGSFGTAASNVGQTAGSYGQTASSFGESNATIASAGARNNNHTQWLFKTHSARWEPMLADLRHDFPGAEIVIEEVREEDMPADLRLARGTADAPDVLLGAPLAMRWARAATGELTDVIVLPRTAKDFPQQTLVSTTTPSTGCMDPDREYAVVARAAHPVSARAFSAWFTAKYSCVDRELPLAKLQAADTVGLHAAEALVKGGSFGAEFDREAVLVPAGLFAAAAGAEMTQAVTHSAGGPLLHAVGVRTLLLDDHVVRVLHTLVILRRDDKASPWRILQITPDMTASMLRDAVATIGSSVAGKPTGTALQPVSLAAPADGDVRIPTPDLWWDNKGGAQLELVEWQPWGPGSRLFLVPDQDSLAKTRVQATFATGGPYRWRVWSLAAGGSVAMTPWRTLTITP